MLASYLVCGDRFRNDGNPPGLTKACFEVPLRTLQQGRTFAEDEIAVLKECSEFEKRGCYVFGMNYPNSSKPLYVGKTEAQSLGSRAFSVDKLLRMQNYLNNQARHYPLVIYLISQKDSRGAPNISDIDAIESWLIWKARERNVELINKRKIGNIVTPQRLQIEYILNNFPKGPPPILIRDFRGIMGL